MSFYSKIVFLFLKKCLSMIVSFWKPSNPLLLHSSQSIGVFTYSILASIVTILISIAVVLTRVHSSVPRHFEKMFTATLLALRTRLVKFHFSTLVKISVFASFALKIEQLSIKWAQECLKLKIWVLIRLKHAWKPKLEIWNFTSLVPRARSVAVNIFSKCHGTDEWTLV